MIRSRLVGVIGAGGPGTGCLVGPGLVLTSAHVVAEQGARVRLFRPLPGDDHTGEVVWCGTPQGRDDAALVRVIGPGWSGREAGPVRWGCFVTDRPQQRVEVWGLPNVVQRDGRDIEVYQLTCEVNPGSGSVNGRHYCGVTQHPPTWTDRRGSPWGGLSGGPVFCGDLLVGVVAEDAAGFAHGAVLAVPAAELHRDPGFCDALKAAGAYAPPEGAELGALADLDRRPSKAPPASPAGLLRPEQSVVPFYGRGDLLARLGQWCAAEGFGGLLLHGAGGQGKTRLAGRLAADLAGTPVVGTDGRSVPWQVWWPDPHAEPQDLAVVRDVAAPLLVVLDYAETRPAQAEALLRAAARHPREHRLKILLMARADGDWWTALRTCSSRSEELLADEDKIALEELQTGPADRRGAYRHALTALATALAAPGGQIAHAPAAPPDWAALAQSLPTPPLDQDGHGNALTLHMTALVDLLDAASTPDGPGGSGESRRNDVERVEDRLLAHEDGYWRGSARTRPDLHGHLSRRTLEESLAASFLVGRVNREQADAVLRRLPSLDGESGGRRAGVRTWISELYPPTMGAAWGSLQPDRLTERFVGRRLSDEPALAHHLAAGAAPAQAAHLLDLYTRAAAHPVFRGGLDAPLRDLCLAHPDVLAPHAVALATRTAAPGPLLSALDTMVRAPYLSPDLLQRLAAGLPPYSERLASWAVLLGRRIVAHDRARPPHDPARLPRLAEHLRQLALRLDETGEREKGLEAAFEAVDIWERLEAAHPGQWLPRLAVGLATLSGRLADHGLVDESLTTIRRSVALRRHLVSLDRETHLRDLASGLLNLAVRLDDLGRLPESLEASRETADLYGELYELRGAEHLAAHAHALHTLAIALRRTGHVEEAHEKITEAVRLRRELAADSPDTHLRDLAMSLTTLANVQEQLEHLEAAVASAGQAVDVSRALVRGRPGSHRSSLVAALLGLGNRLHALGRHAEALTVSEEAADVARAAAAERPETGRIMLAHTLKNLSADLATAEQHDRALDAVVEAVGAVREAARTNPGAARAELPSVLRQWLRLLVTAGRTAEAQAPSGEAVALLTALADAEPDRYLPDLTAALLEHSEVLRALDRTEESLDAAESAVGLLRRLGTVPDGLDPLRTALLIDRYAMQRFAQGRGGAALRGVDTALRIHRAADAPNLTLTAAVLHHRAVILALLQRGDEADRALAEAIRIRRTLVSEDPGRHGLDLLEALGTQVWILAELGRTAEATSVLAEALEVLRGPLRALPGAPADSWVMPLFRIAVASAQLGPAGPYRERAAEATARLDRCLRRPDSGSDLARAFALLSRLGPPTGPR
ncbi:trypsin-like peptidase domain-containing protein [Streptomyces avidinii]|uniref:trypsin-like peptidase domain-containing protein n=1 Tax=Streptomyces avidinii TaxID=1895 RepID=UPI00386760AF|nr:trypsin-like peptidase domain-containing protein [Streptomyces avidinii]